MPKLNLKPVQYNILWDHRLNVLILCAEKGKITLVLILILFILQCDFNTVEANLIYASFVGSWVSLLNFETIRGSLMRHQWRKLASLAPKICKL